MAWVQGQVQISESGAWDRHLGGGRGRPRVSPQAALPQLHTGARTACLPARQEDGEKTAVEAEGTLHDCWLIVAVVTTVPNK